MSAKHFDLMSAAKQSQQRFLQEAEQGRLVKQAKRTQPNSNRSFKQRFGQQLMELGRKLAQEPETNFNTNY